MAWPIASPLAKPEHSEAMPLNGTFSMKGEETRAWNYLESPLKSPRALHNTRKVRHVFQESFEAHRFNSRNYVVIALTMSARQPSERLIPAVSSACGKTVSGL